MMPEWRVIPTLQFWHSKMRVPLGQAYLSNGRPAGPLQPTASPRDGTLPIEKVSGSLAGSDSRLESTTNHFNLPR